jgi:hypothetical protein
MLSNCAPDTLATEAYLFGTAGFLDGEFEETYPKQLKDMYSRLSALKRIPPMNSHVWCFRGARPVAFPTIRIAQLAGLICDHHMIFNEVFLTTGLQAMDGLYECRASAYWDNHFLFGRTSSDEFSKTAGASFRRQLMINCSAPLIFARGKMEESERMVSQALEILDNLPAEDNILVKKWADTGVAASSAFHTQALAELKQNYCDRRNCLNCRIGFMLLSKKHIKVEHDNAGVG